jgi:hypothetical protein
MGASFGRSRSAFDLRTWICYKNKGALPPFSRLQPKQKTMRSVSAFCSGGWGGLAILLYIATFGVNIWNIVIDARAISADESCSAAPLETFLIGSIVASAVTLLAFVAGIGWVFTLVWAILGQNWLRQARYACALSAPYQLHVAHQSLGVLWYNVGVGFVIGFCMCIAAIFAADAA